MYFVNDTPIHAPLLQEYTPCLLLDDVMILLFQIVVHSALFTRFTTRRKTFASVQNAFSSHEDITSFSRYGSKEAGTSTYILPLLQTLWFDLDLSLIRARSTFPIRVKMTLYLSREDI